MKKYLLTAYLLATAISVNAQGRTVEDSARLYLSGALTKGPAPTSQEEYNYVTKGLAIQRSSGLDMKAGYSLTNRNGLKTGDYTVVLEDLIRNADKSFAATIITVETTPNKVFLYLCSPNAASMAANGSAIQLQYWSSLNNIQSLSVMRAISNAVALRLGVVNSGIKR